MGRKKKISAIENASTPKVTEEFSPRQTRASSKNIKSESSVRATRGAKIADVPLESIVEIEEPPDPEEEVSTKQRKTKHNLVENADGMFGCKECPSVFKHRQDLVRHSKKHEDPASWPKCDVCGKTFARNEVLVAHARIHTKEKPFACDRCGKNYRYKHALVNHALVHTGARPFSCDICEKNFTQRVFLTLHMRTHTDERPHRCGLCGKAFRQKSHVRYHMLTHTGLRAHACTVCGKTFAFKQAFLLHIKMHQDIRPHKCEQCGKMFREKPKLKVHERTHTMEKPYRCRLCNKDFSQKGNRDKHELKYHTRDKDRKYACTNCSKSFIWQRCLEIHIEQHCEAIFGPKVKGARATPKRTAPITLHDDTIDVYHEDARTRTVGTQTVEDFYTSVNRLLTHLLEGATLEEVGYPRAPVDLIVANLIGLHDCKALVSGESGMSEDQTFRENVKILLTLVMEGDEALEYWRKQPIEDLVESLLSSFEEEQEPSAEVVGV